MLKDDIKNVRGYIKDAKEGLPFEIFEFISTITPMINVDLLIKNKEGEILLSWRDDMCGQGWHIPGGIIRFKEKFEDRIQKTALRELGTKVEFDRQPVDINEIIMPQDLRGHFISFLYRCYLPHDFVLENVVRPNESPENIKEGMLAWHRICPDNLVQGQNEIYRDVFNINR